MKYEKGTIGDWGDRLWEVAKSNDTPEQKKEKFLALKKEAGLLSLGLDENGNVTPDKVEIAAKVYAKQEAIKYLSWYIQSGYEAENIEGTIFTLEDDPENKISAEELHLIFKSQSPLK